jgi:hypothetical protein
MKEVGAAVSQANKTNHPDITGAPTCECNSHVPSLLVQEDSRKTICITAELFLNEPGV